MQTNIGVNDDFKTASCAALDQFTSAIPYLTEREYKSSLSLLFLKR